MIPCSCSRFLWWTFLIFSTLLFNACDTPQDIGVELQAEGQLIQTLFTDTITVNAQLVRRDSIETDGVSNLLVGAIQDPDFGNYRAESYFKMNFTAADSIDLAGSEDEYPAIDSLIFVLSLQNTYGDTTQPVEVGLFPLRSAEDLVDTLDYYQFDRLPAEETPLASVPYPDSLTDDRLLRLRLDTNLVSQNLNENGVLIGEQFVQDFSAFRLAALNPSVPRSVLSIGRTQSRLVVYYSYPGDTTSRAVTLFIGKSFVGTELDYSSTAFPRLAQESPVPTSQTNNRLYIQAGTGINARITFPHLDKFRTEADFRVHRAELRFPTVAPTISDNYPPPESVFFFESDPFGNFALSESGGEIPLPFEGVTGQALFIRYSGSGRNYSDANITTYLQELLDGTRENNGIILAPSGNESSLNRVIFQDASSFNDRQLQLRLYYTIVQ